MLSRCAFWSLTLVAVLLKCGPITGQTTNTAPICGDGICDASESDANANNCPADCSSGSSATCVLKQADIQSQLYTLAAKQQLTYNSTGVLLSALLTECTKSDVQPLRPLHILGVEQVNATFVALANAYKASTGFDIDLEFQPVENLGAEIIHSFTSAAGLYDGYYWESSAATDLNDIGALPDLGSLVLASKGLAWSDLLPVIRDSVSVYNSRIVSIPTGGSFINLFYRRDLLSGRPPPDTWEELVAAAVAWNGTDIDDDGVGEHALCIITRSAEPYETATVLMSILATYTQVGGPSSGFLLHPETVRPLLGTAAGLKAFQVYRELKTRSAYLLNDFPLINGSVLNSNNSAFLYGKCVFSISFPITFKGSIRVRNGAMKGRIGSALMPGAREVLDRATNQLVPCTPQLCTDMIVREGVTQWINRSPYAGVNMVGASINPKADASYRDATFNFIALSTSVQTDPFSVFSPDANIGPTRYRHLELANWLRLGYDPQDVSQYLTTVSSLTSHPNTFAAPRYRGSAQHMAILSEASYLMRSIPAADLPALVATTQSRLEAAIASVSGGDTRGFRLTYWQSINYDYSMWQEGGSSDGLSAGQLAASIVVPVVVAVLAVAAMSWLYTIHRRQHRTLTGAPRPPGVGPQTTIAITDIQDSTPLYELLDPEVMDGVVAKHHALMRRAIRAHTGYEVGTEGDSFLIAFHSAQAAVLFATQVQRQLMEVAWPQQLLSVESAQRAWAVPTSCQPGWAAGRLMDGLDGQAPSGDEARPQRLLSQILSWCKPRQSRSGGASYQAAAHVAQKEVQLETQRSHILPGLTVEEGEGKEGPTGRAGAAPTILQQLLESYHVVYAGAGAAAGEPAVSKSQLIFGGLRVRIGMASGLTSVAGMVRSPVTGRTQYTGELMAAAKAVQDCAQGGMVLLAESSFLQLNTMGLAEAQVLVAHMGTHVLSNISNGQPPQPLYAAMHECLIPRLAHLGPIRSQAAHGLGFLAAPAKQAAIAFMTVVGAAHVIAWDVSVAARALALYHELAQAELAVQEGYAVEVAEGLVLSAFRHPRHAIRWALRMLDTCLAADWPTELLESELGEEIRIGGVLSPTGGEAPAFSALIMRGLRLKVGIDVGQVATTVHAVLARPTYKGKVMNRAARIMSVAKTGQVWASATCWALASGTRQYTAPKYSSAGGTVTPIAELASSHNSGTSNKAATAIVASNTQAATSNQNDTSSRIPLQADGSSSTTQLPVTTQPPSITIPSSASNVQPLLSSLHDGNSSEEEAITCIPLGSHKLKGIPGEVQLVQCVWDSRQVLPGTLAISFSVTRGPQSVAAMTYKPRGSASQVPRLVV